MSTGSVDTYTVTRIHSTGTCTCTCTCKCSHNCSSQGEKNKKENLHLYCSYSVASTKKLMKERSGWQYRMQMQMHPTIRCTQQKYKTIHIHVTFSVAPCEQVSKLCSILIILHVAKYLTGLWIHRSIYCSFHVPSLSQSVYYVSAC